DGDANAEGKGDKWGLPAEVENALRNADDHNPSGRAVYRRETEADRRAVEGDRVEGTRVCAHIKQCFPGGDALAQVFLSVDRSGNDIAVAVDYGHEHLVLQGS